MEPLSPHLLMSRPTHHSMTHARTRLQKLPLLLPPPRKYRRAVGGFRIGLAQLPRPPPNSRQRRLPAKRQRSREIKILTRAPRLQSMEARRKHGRFCYKSVRERVCETEEPQNLTCRGIFVRSVSSACEVAKKGGLVDWQEAARAADSTPGKEDRIEEVKSSELEVLEDRLKAFYQTYAPERVGRYKETHGAGVQCGVSASQPRLHSDPLTPLSGSFGISPLLSSSSLSSFPAPSLPHSLSFLRMCARSLGAGLLRSPANTCAIKRH